MGQLRAITVDLDSCVGCYACELACKQENDVAIGKRWTMVIPVGPEEVDGKLRMDFMHVNSDECNFCQHRLDQHLLPRCVDNCPMGALGYHSNAVSLLSAISNGRRIQVCRLEAPPTAYA